VTQRFTSRVRAAATAVLALVIMPGASLYHTHLKASLPAKDEVVTKAPESICLTFSARPELALSDVKLFTADSTAVRIGKVMATDDSLTIGAALPADLAPGQYTVAWRTASKDGHVIRGRYRFSYTPK
jgi:copper resistance protein C